VSIAAPDPPVPASQITEHDVADVRVEMDRLKLQLQLAMVEAQAAKEEALASAQETHRALAEQEQKIRAELARDQHETELAEKQAAERKAEQEAKAQRGEEAQEEAGQEGQAQLAEEKPEVADCECQTESWEPQVEASASVSAERQTDVDQEESSGEAEGGAVVHEERQGTPELAEFAGKDLSCTPTAFQFISQKSTTATHPATAKTIFSLTASIFEEKIAADLADDRAHRPRQSLADFTRDWCITKYGLRSLAMRNLRGLLAGTIKFNDEPRCVVFKYLSGLVAGSEWEETACDYVLFTLQKAFQPNTIRDRLERGSIMRVEVAAEATVAGFSCPHFIGDKDQCLDNVDKLQRVGEGRIQVDDWMLVLTETWKEGSSVRLQQLLSLFDDFDRKGDNTLDFNDFEQMILSIATTMSRRDIVQLYQKVMEASHGRSGWENDSIDRHAFARVMIANKLVPPYVDFSSRSLNPGVPPPSDSVSVAEPDEVDVSGDQTTPAP